MQSKGWHMRKIIVSNMMTLDSLVAGPNGEIDWFVAGDDFFEDMSVVYERIGTILFGRITYEGMERFWTGADADAVDPTITEYMNKTATVVFSRTLDQVTWHNTRLMKGEIGDEVTKLKQEPGKDIIIYGSSTIVSQLTQPGLIDEYWLFINPVILGSGTPEFSGITRQVNLRLSGVKTLQGGTVRLMYEPA
jgi:dihydrofolate reductase